MRPLGDREPSWDEVFGMATYEPADFDIFGEEWQEYRESLEDAAEHPDAYMPLGSEGSLQREVFVNPNESCLAAYVVTVFGDLRDHDSFDDIREWFERSCGRCFIRQAVCDVEVEGWSGTRHEVWSWRDDVLGKETAAGDGTADGAGGIEVTAG